MTTRKPTAKMTSLLNDLKVFNGPFEVNLSARTADKHGHIVRCPSASFWGLVDRGLLIKVGATSYRVA